MFTPPEDFNLRAYAAQSFGIYQEEPIDVVLRIEPGAAQDAASWQFHPTQRITHEDNGGLTVRFRAGGILEMCWHFFTWGTALTIVAPDNLREAMAKLTAVVAEHHAIR